MIEDIVLRLFSSMIAPSLLMSLLVVQTADASFDFLEIPAYTSERAAQGMLLDVITVGERLVAVGERGHIVYSDDVGKSWVQATVPVYVTMTAVHFPSAQKGWAVGHDGVILHSDDGGATWRKQLDGYAINEKSLTLAQKNVGQARQILQDVNNSEEAESQDWRNMAAEALDEAEFKLDSAKEDSEVGPAKPLLDVWFKNEQEGFAIGAYGIFLHTENAGESWELWSARLNNADDFHLNAISASSNGSVLIAGESGALFRSQDGGQTWDRLESPYLGPFYGLLMVPAESQADDTILAFGLKGNLYRSSDFGVNWNQVDSGTQAALYGGTVVGNGDVVTIVGSAGVVLHSNDGGHNFIHTQDSRRITFTQAVALSGVGVLAVSSVRGVHELSADGSKK